MSHIIEIKLNVRNNESRKSILVLESIFNLLLLYCVQLLIPSLSIRSVILQLKNCLEDLLKYSSPPPHPQSF